MSKSIAVRLAGAAALAGSTQAYGQIISVTPPSDLPGHAPGVGVDSSEYYNVLTGATDATQQPGDNFEFTYHNSANFLLTFVTGVSPSDQLASTPGYYFYANAISAGTKIGTDTMHFYPASDPSVPIYKTYLTVVSNTTNATYSLQQPGVDTFLGFQFVDSQDSQIHNGYIELESVAYTDPTNPGGLFFRGAAYNSLPDSAANGAGDITAEAVPEPGTISSLMLGAAALGAIGLARRRRAMVGQV